MLDNKIKRLGTSDTAAFRDMQALYADVFEEHLTYLGSPPDDAYVARVLARPETIALVAYSNGAVVGALTAYELAKFEQARSEVYIYDLAVATACRRRGIASKLIAEVQRIAQDMGAWVVFVQADHGDAPAIALYTKFGTREDVLHFDLPVIAT